MSEEIPLNEPNDLEYDSDDSEYLALEAARKAEELAAAARAAEITIPKPIYTDDELEKLVGFIQDMTFLANIKNVDWSDQLGVIREFFENVANRVLFIGRNKSNKLMCTFDCSSFADTEEIMCFYREEINECYSVDTFHDRICFMNVTGDLYEYLIGTISAIFAPLTFNNETWPSGVKSNFAKNIHVYLNALTDLHNKKTGKTILYTPCEHLDTPVEELLNDGEYCKRLETVVVQWIRQIRTAIGQMNGQSDSVSSLIDEYDFWTERCANLTGIYEQLQNKHVKRIINIMTVSHSSYSKQILQLAIRTEQALNEAKTNIAFLRVLKQPCEQLKTAINEQNRSATIHLIVDIFQIIRILWRNCPYYRNDERLTFLCRLLTNQIVAQCIDNLNLTLVFSGQTRQAIEMFKSAIELSEEFEEVYKKLTKAHADRDPTQLWSPNEELIFNHIHTFAIRCRDMIEVCHTMIIFARLDEQLQPPKPQFCGVRAFEFEQICENVETTLKTNVKQLEMNQSLIFNVRTNDWNEMILKYRVEMKHIETMLSNLMHSIFHDLHIDEYFDTLAFMFNYSKCASLRDLFELKAREGFEAFRKLMHLYKTNVFEERDVYFGALPRFSGRGVLLRSKIARLNGLYQKIEKAIWLDKDDLLDDIKTQLNSLNDYVESIIRDIYRDWLKNISKVNFQALLNVPLMQKPSVDLGILICNLDPIILTVADETYTWNQLKFDVSPASIVYNNREKIQLMHCQVTQIVANFNRLVDQLSDEEKTLFRIFLTTCERKISPGLNGALQWTTDIADAYLNDCLSAIVAMQSFVDDYKICVAEVVRICQAICEINFIDDPTYECTLREFLKRLHHTNEKAVLVVIEKFRRCIEYLIVVYEGFESHMGVEQLQESWKIFVQRFDLLVETSLKIAVKTSLNRMVLALHGSPSINPTPFLRMDLTLSDDIETDPSIKSVLENIACILPGVVTTIERLPRIYEEMHVDNLKLDAFHDVVINDDDCQKLQMNMVEDATTCAIKLTVYLKQWEPFRAIWTLSKDDFICELKNENPSAARINELIRKYTELSNAITLMESFTPVHFIMIHCKHLKRKIVWHCLDWQVKFTSLTKTLITENIDFVFAYTAANKKAVQVKPETIPELQDLLKMHQQLIDELPQEEKRFTYIDDLIHVLDSYAFKLNQNVLIKYDKLKPTWQEYLKLLYDVDLSLKEYQDAFKRDLNNQADIFQRATKSLLEEFLEHAPIDNNWTSDNALEYLRKMRENVDRLRDEEKQIRDDLAVFDVTFDESGELLCLEQNINSLSAVWQCTQRWHDASNRYKTTGFWQTNVDEMERTANDIHKQLTTFERELHEKNWPIITQTKQSVDVLRRILPLITALKNPALKSRHWLRLKDIFTADFDPFADSFTIETLANLDLREHYDVIFDVSNCATMELQIEEGIKTIAEAWERVEMLFVSKTGNLLQLVDVDECFQTLENHSVSVASMKNSRYVEPFITEVNYWEKTLTYILECLELFLNVQRQYFYMENVLTGEDISKQLPTETSDFKVITAEWKNITERMQKERTCKSAVLIDEPPVLYDTLTSLQEKLEFIQHGLEKYMETKRRVFPRFYFISNDDLLEILGNQKKHEIIQRHLKKLFDNLVGIHVDETTDQKFTTAISASDKEVVNLLNPLLTSDGPIEIWFNALEASSRNTLRDQLRHGLLELKKPGCRRPKWLKEFPGQICIIASVLKWTSDCTKALIRSETLRSTEPLQELLIKQNEILSRLTDMCRGELTKMHRLKTSALITIEIHARDVIEKMLRSNCITPNHFEWFSQLRYYWDRDVDNCVIKQTVTNFTYGYEYTGNSGRLVITPLTDRCYLTLTTALYLNRGGSPKGPAGTGKTETVKDLGKALGLWVIVINCSEGFDYKSMGKIFSGLAQSGCWGCFDEFNRMNIEVLSVVAQQVMSIIQALAAKQEIFSFEGTQTRLTATIGMFITMNPGYAGRTELPDNLKSMFRPISMMVPDNVIIAENLLFSDGFQTAKDLAKKVYTMYDIMQQQLSKQHHYDFGLRSIVSLLRFAAVIRRQHAELTEEQAVYVSTMQINLARVTSTDLPVFLDIVNDIFYDIKQPSVTNAEFISAVKVSLESKRYKTIPAAIAKVQQLFETKKFRHSVMILGDTGTAKSVTWQTLADTLTDLKKMAVEGYEAVRVFPINPKSLSLGELYGEYNFTTNEWLDGVLSSIARQICAEETLTEKWLIFDGPVDALWIENMNSVMDDNKILTLINGERITFPPQVTLLFEVGSLHCASPATVSRCGIVYNDYRDWGWRPFVDAWIEKHDSVMFRDEMTDYFTNYLDIILNFKYDECHDVVPVNELNQIKSLCTLLDIFLTQKYGLDESDVESYPIMIKLWFLFCVIWSIGMTLDDESRKYFDVKLREVDNVFPVKNTVFDYFVDVETKSFVSWDQKLNTDWSYDVNTPFYKINVPTIDTIRYEFIMLELVANGHATLLIGPVGTGKSTTSQVVLDNFTDNYVVIKMNMSANTSSNNVQEIIESKIEKRTKNTFVPINGKKLLVFLDDLNMPAKDTYGSQPPLELLRHWIDYGFFYDRNKQTRKYVQDMFILTAMGYPGGGRNDISPRFMSRFNILNIPTPNRDQIFHIFRTIIRQHLRDFDDVVKNLTEPITNATIDLYTRVTTKMLPTPAKIHYLFNLREISRIFQGLTRSRREYKRDDIIRLWIHECYRVFNDRMVDVTDHEWFTSEISEKVTIYFEQTFIGLCPGNNPPIFGDFINPHGFYEDLKDINQVRKFFETQLFEYNNAPGRVSMDLVLFKHAISHLCAIKRVIGQVNCHMLLIGIGGSGRQSLSRLAAFLCDYDTYQIQITKTYKLPDFKEDIKKLYYQCGVQNRSTLFLFSDAQLPDDTFLEILNNMLNNGELANLFSTDEMEKIKNELMNSLPADIPPTSEAIYAYFIERAQANIHIILCLSPHGPRFRNWLRQYPSLINCTTIDWFGEWPQQALVEVANKYLSDVDYFRPIPGLPSMAPQSENVLSDYHISNELERLRHSMANVFAEIHCTVVKYAVKMRAEMKRVNYLTPTSYLLLVVGYKTMLESKQDELSKMAIKFYNGVKNIIEARDKVENMTIELIGAQNAITLFQSELDATLLSITEQKNKADEATQKLTARRLVIIEEEKQCMVLKVAAESDLKLAMPELEEAISALDALNKNDISEIRSYAKPPKRVEKVLEAVMILKGIEPTWAESKHQMGDPNFVLTLRDFDKNHVSDKTLRKIGFYTSDTDFMPEKVGAVSQAAKSLCMWVRAIEKYAKVWKIVAPKQAKLDEAEMSLNQKQAEMDEASRELKRFEEKLLALQSDYQQKIKQKEELSMKADNLKTKIERASMLVSGFINERERWNQTIETISAAYKCLVGDCILAIAFLSYAGPFTSNYRDELVEIWRQTIQKNQVQTSENLLISKFLSDDNTVREWKTQGLPSDQFSVENAIIISECVNYQRWPLIIDPQNQATKWIKKCEEKIVVVDPNKSDYMKQIERAISDGTTILLENIGDKIDADVEPVLRKSLIRQGSRLMIKLIDKVIDYDNGFRLFITTKLNNPHYSPEIMSQTTVINFVVKPSSLQAQLLSIVVRREKPALEQQKDALVLNIAKAKKNLTELEDELLRLLYDAGDTILDNEILINTLKTMKTTTKKIQESIEINEKTEKEIDAAREIYTPCSKRASILYFILNDLANVDPMYQYSLDAFVALFNLSIEKSAKSKDASVRINALNDYHTFAVFRHVNRGLFERHKLVFLLHMCVRILESLGKINMDEYQFLLKGGVVLDRSQQPDNPCSSWLPDSSWDNITELGKLPAFQNIVASFDRFPREWRNWFNHTEPENQPLTGEYESTCKEFQRILIIRALRLDRLPHCIMSFIANNLGQRFIEPSNLDLNSIYAEMNPSTPVIFMLSPGVDPIASLNLLADALNMKDRLNCLSLGQGQSAIAARLLHQGVKDGNWVYLANCHLSISWMARLDNTVEQLSIGKIHKDFRLWLSSSPTSLFPISVLQASIKVAVEPPQGLKANLLNVYNLITTERFQTCVAQDKYKKLLYSLAWFHSVLIERKKFRQLGWNVIYSYGNADFDVSETLLQTYLSEYEETPWDALKYVIAAINYGGHVTDDWDRRLLMTYAAQYFCDDVLQVAEYRLSSLAHYFIPKSGSLESYHDHIAILPNMDKSEAFGQHPNADVASSITNTRQFCEVLLSMQDDKSVLASDVISTEDKVLQMINDILTTLPSLIDYHTIDKLIGPKKSSLEIVHLQEVLRYNELLIKIKNTLEHLQLGIKGLSLMSIELENVMTSLNEGRVPVAWLNVYPSLKSIGAWTQDLIERVEYFHDWANTTQMPTLFWLSAYTFPTSFLTAVLQMEARKRNVPLISLRWNFLAVNLPERSISRPDNGVMVRGLFLEGANWDRLKQCLSDAMPLQLICHMPVVHFRAVEMVESSVVKYNCPCYYHPLREPIADKPSCVVVIHLNSGAELPDFWIKRGTAILLSLPY